MCDTLLTSGPVVIEFREICPGRLAFVQQLLISFGSPESVRPTQKPVSSADFLRWIGNLVDVLHSPIGENAAIRVLFKTDDGVCTILQVFKATCKPDNRPISVWV